jgi:hypothetical protein
MTQNWRKIGTRLKARLNSKEAYEILDRYIGGTWTEGGCCLLAKTLNRLVPGKIITLYGKNSYGIFRGIFRDQHVLLEVKPSYYLDGDGFSSKETIIKRWNLEESITNIELREYDNELNVFPNNHIDELYEFLKPMFKNS